MFEKFEVKSFSSEYRLRDFVNQARIEKIINILYADRIWYLFYYA